MQRASIACMEAKPIQIRDVPVDAIEVMRVRAAAEGLSLTAYLRRMVVEAAAQPTVAEVLARAAQRPAAGLTMADIVAATRAGRGE
jgi:antitoxin FitA